MNSRLSPNPTSEPLIDFDLPCVACGYNLRMQPRDGRCPECATPVAKSLNTFALDGANPTWCQQTAQSLRFLSWVLACYVSLYVWDLVSWLIFMFDPFSGNIDVADVVAVYIRFAADVALFAAIWRITLPDPQAFHRWRRTRITLRIAVSIVFAMVILRIPMFTWELAVNGIYDSFPTQSPGAILAFVIYTATKWVQTPSMSVVQLALLALLWRWFRCGQRLTYRRLVGIVFWILLAKEAISIFNLVVREITPDPIGTIPSWIDAIGEISWRISRISELLCIPLLFIILIAVRAVAAMMLRLPDNTPTASEPT